MWLAGEQASRGRHLFSPFRCRRLLLLLASLRRFSAPHLPADPTHCMVDYLRSSCGFSDDEAWQASRHYAHLKSPEKPDAVLRLLRQEGLGDADIKRVVQRVPKLLLADAKRTVEPKIRALQGAGFSRPELAQLVSLNPGNILFVRDVGPRVEFWRKLVGTNWHILKAMKMDRHILCYNLDKRVVPGVSLLCSLGVPESKMGSLARKKPRLVCGHPDRTRAVVERVKSLGFLPGTVMFVEALCTIDNLSRSTLDAKLKFLRSFGWTQAELVSAFQRFPAMLRYSQEKLHAVMEFLLNEAGCEPSHIARNPALVGYSLEKRLKPRFFVLQSLRAEGLPAGRGVPSSAMLINEDSFIKKYITPYSGKLPELLETYHAACGEDAKANIGSL